MTKRTRQELEENLAEQLHFLQSSCDAYDAGHYAEYKRMAQTLRILLHDGSPPRRKGARQQFSLLAQLGIKEGISYINTAMPVMKGNLMGHHGLVGVTLKIGYTAKYTPILNDDTGTRNPRTSFELWWNEIVISESQENEEFKGLSRKDLVLEVANTDGGGHIDLELGDNYIAFARNNLAGMRMKYTDDPNEEWSSVGNPIPPSLRQIAHEILATLSRARYQVFRKTQYKPTA